MKFQRYIIALVVLSASYASLFPAAKGKDVVKTVRMMSPREIRALDLKKLTDVQLDDLVYTALLSGLEHKRNATRDVINKGVGKALDWNALKNVFFSGGVGTYVKGLKGPEQKKMQQAIVSGLFSGFAGKRAQARRVVEADAAAKGQKINWVAFRENFTRLGLGPVFDELLEDDDKEEEFVESKVKVMDEPLIADLPTPTYIPEEEAKPATGLLD